MPSVNKLSDIKFTVSFFGSDGNPENVTGSTWTMNYYTTNPGAPIVTSYSGGTFSSNCFVDPLDDTKLIVVFNEPNFAPGNLNTTSTQYYVDPDFPDNNYKIVRTYSTGITIV
jgi:hypothetical protein